MQPETILLIGLGFALGGILKGAVGAGAPILAVPLLAVFYDVPLAVTLFVIPNLVPNLWQGWKFRAHRLPWNFTLRFALAGAFGAIIGTYILASLPSDWLKLGVALVVFLYVAFRLLHPNGALEYRRAVALALPVGTLAGILQGASGVSAPVSITFLNAMRMERLQFIATISVFFVALGLVQMPLLAGFGFLTWQNLMLSTIALVPLVAGMPLGAFLVRHISKQTFDRLILILLFGLAIKLTFESLGAL